MKFIWTIMKKELARVFKDPRLMLIIFLFPGLMIYVMYSVMGNFMTSEKEDYIVETYNMNEEVEGIIKINYPDIVIKANDDLTIDQAKENINNGISDVAIIFDENFDVNSVDMNDVNIVYNMSNSNSSNAFDAVNVCLEQYRSTIQAQKYGANFQLFKTNILGSSDEKKAMGQIYALILPFLIITFLFSGVSSVVPESIAGEKERGTIATLLVTPIKRSYLALGKITSLSILAVLSAISSFIGIVLSLPKMLGSSSNVENIYGFKEYAIVLIILVITVLVLVSIVSLLSALAKNIKEASMLTLPLMLISMGIGISSMFGSSSTTSPILFVIPIYNSIQMLSEIFTFSVDSVHLIITIISNLIYTGLMVYVLTRMFNSEKIMFSK